MYWLNSIRKVCDWPIKAGMLISCGPKAQKLNWLLAPVYCVNKLNSSTKLTILKLLKLLFKAKGRLFMTSLFGNKQQKWLFSQNLVVSIFFSLFWWLVPGFVVECHKCAHIYTLTCSKESWNEACNFSDCKTVIPVSNWGSENGVAFTVGPVL